MKGLVTEPGVAEVETGDNGDGQDVSEQGGGGAGEPEGEAGEVGTQQQLAENRAEEDCSLRWSWWPPRVLRRRGGGAAG